MCESTKRIGVIYYDTDKIAKSIGYVTALVNDGINYDVAMSGSAEYYSHTLIDSAIVRTLTTFLTTPMHK